jgi:hypothetical protein
MTPWRALIPFPFFLPVWLCHAVATTIFGVIAAFAKFSSYMQDDAPPVVVTLVFKPALGFHWMQATLAAQATHRQDARLEGCNLSYHDILHSSTPDLCLSVNMRLCHRIRTFWAALFLPALDVLGCTLSDLLKPEKCPHQACHHVPPRARRCSPAHCRYDLLPG